MGRFTDTGTCTCGIKMDGRSKTCRECYKRIRYKYPRNVTKKELLLDIRGGRWDTYRSHITRDARKKYQESGKPNLCYICNYDIYTEVCHRISVASFPLEATLLEINDPNNLVRLCPNHHWEFDHGIIELQSGEEVTH